MNAWINRAPTNKIFPPKPYISIRHSLFEKLDGLAHVGSETHLSAKLNESLRAKATAMQGIRCLPKLQEQLFAKAAGIMALKPLIDVRETLNAQAKLGANLYILDRNIDEQLKIKAKLGANIHFGAAFSENLQSQATLGAYIYTNYALYETLNGYAAVYDIVENTTTINGVIPAGSTLVIDAQNKEMYLDHQNAIHLHSGAWLEVSRRTLQYTLSASNTDHLEMEVYCDALYL